MTISNKEKILDTIEKKQYKIFIDDYRIPLDCIKYMHSRIGKKNPIYLDRDWVRIKSYKQFVKCIKKNGLPFLISFDHDLHESHYAPQEYWDDSYDEWAKVQNFVEKTGYDCAKWLVDYCMINNVSLPECFVHSENPHGTKNIITCLENFKKQQDTNES